EELTARGLTVDTQLAMGDPSTELIRAAEEQQVDLIAMSTHGHRFLNDLIRGATADRVRHLVKIPVLLLRAQYQSSVFSHQSQSSVSVVSLQSRIAARMTTDDAHW